MRGRLTTNLRKATTVHWLEIVDHMLRLSFKKGHTVLKKKKDAKGIFFQKNITSRHDPKLLFNLKDSWQQTYLVLLLCHWKWDLKQTLYGTGAL